MKISETNVFGLECLRLENDSHALVVTSTVGPRILQYIPYGGQNLFAELPDKTLFCPGVGPMHLWGGHRLWHSPENSRRTYIPDDSAPAVSEIYRGLKLVQPIELQTGIQKTIQITFPDNNPVTVIDHWLTNYGTWPIPCAPWTITMFKPGGTAILPQSYDKVDEEGLLPNREIVFWPYSDVLNPFVMLGNRYVFCRANMQSGAWKIGFPNQRGWLAYYQPPYLFVKKAHYRFEYCYPDHGCSSEFYCCADFVELETLGNYASIDPGESVGHREVWETHEIKIDEFREDVLDLLDERLALSKGSSHLL